MYFGFICAILAFSLYVGEGMPINPPPDENDCDFTTDLEVLAACKQRYMNQRRGLNSDQNESRIGSKLDKYKEQLNSMRTNGYMNRKIIDDSHQEKFELYNTSKSKPEQKNRRKLNNLSKLLGVEPSKQNAQTDQSRENESVGQLSQPSVDANRSILDEQSMSDDDQLVPDHSTAAAENSSKNVPKESTSEKRKRSEFIN
ncbi:hypothetical protein niasHS_001906 [Heterodera schachtii]|uniref:Uncharacterized protein n=1 Tax=Heterodera schachtii TaxID=97005 RepID=A0ABD2KAM6_HETSC